MIIRIDQFYNTVLINIIKKGIQKDPICVDKCYWIAGYYLNQNNNIFKISPTYGYISTRSMEYFEYGEDIHLAIYNKESGRIILNIPEKVENDASTGSLNPQFSDIYISDSEEKISKVYNDLVFNSFNKIDKMIKNLTVQKRNAECDFYKSDIVMETLIR